MNHKYEVQGPSEAHPVLSTALNSSIPEHLSVGMCRAAGKSCLLGRESHLESGRSRCLVKSREGSTAEVSC